MLTRILTFAVLSAPTIAMLLLSCGNVLLHHLHTVQKDGFHGALTSIYRTPKCRNMLANKGHLYLLAWRLTGSPVPLFSLCKCLAFSIPYIMQPVTVSNRCTLSQHAMECCFRCKLSSFLLRHRRFTCVQLTYTYLTANVQHLAP